MAGNVTVELDLQGINAIMSSDEVKAVIADAAKDVANTARNLSGQSYGSNAKVTSRRWVAVGNVYPETSEAGADNYRNNTLEKALGQAGLRRRKE